MANILQVGRDSFGFGASVVVALVGLLVPPQAQSSLGSKIWEFQADSSVNCAPAIGEDGTIFIGVTSGRVYAIDWQTGQEKWNALLGGAASSPVVGANDLMYVTSDGGTLNALSLATGQKIWSFSASTNLTMPALASDGTIFIGSANGSVYAVDGAKGKKMWEYAAGSAVSSTPSIGADGGVYVGLADGKVHAIDPATGSNRWIYTNDPGKSVSIAIGADGTLYDLAWLQGVPIFSSVPPGYTSPTQPATAVIALDPATGGEKWTNIIMAYFGYPDTVLAIGPDGKIFVSISTGFMPNDYGVTYALNPGDGSYAWGLTSGQGFFQHTGYNIPSGVHSSPAIGADGTVYFGSSPSLNYYGGVLYMVNGYTGQILQTNALGGSWIYSSPAVGANGTVYIGTDAGKLFAISGTTNQGLAAGSWTKSFGNARNTSSKTDAIGGGNAIIQRLAQGVTVASRAGSGQAAFANGIGTNASFNSPGGCWVAADGTVYLADTGNHRIRKVSADGNVTTIAGTGVAGHQDGPAGSAQFSGPVGVYLDKQGNLWIAETNNYIRKIDSAGQVSTVAGTGVPGYVDGAGSIAQFNAPHGLVADNLNNVWVADCNNHAVRRIAADGTVSTWAGNGTAGDVDGDSEVALLNQPSGIARDSSGILYISEQSGNRIRRIQVDGRVSTLAGSGTAGYIDSSAALARFNQPDGLVLDAQNNLWVADVQNQAVRRIDPQGSVQTAAGTLLAGYADGSGKNARFSSPSGIGIDGQGVVYVIDSGNERVRKFTLSGDLALASIQDRTWDVNQTLTIPVQFVNTNSDGLGAFSLMAGAPEGMSIDPQSGILSWTPPPLYGRTTNHIGVRISNTNGISDTKFFQIVVNSPANVPGGELWEFSSGGAISSCPAVDNNGTVYFGSADKKVYAIDADGHKKWEFLTGGAVDCAPVLGAGGMVYIGSDDGKLYALDATNGHKYWEFDATQPIRCAPVISPDYTVYFGSISNQFYALDALTGSNKWSFTLAVGLTRQPILSEGILYLGVHDATTYPANVAGVFGPIYALNSHTGNPLWENTNTLATVSSGFALGTNGILCLNSGIGTLLGLNTNNGSAKFECGPPSTDRITNAVESPGAAWDRMFSYENWILYRQRYLAPAIGTDNTFLSVMPNSTLWSVDSTTGAKKWSFEYPLNQMIASSPAVGSDGTVYAGTMFWNGVYSDEATAGIFYALNGSNGTELWQFPIDTTPSPIAIGPSGTLYVGTASGKLYAITGNSKGGLANSPWPKFQANTGNTGAILPPKTNQPPVLTMPATQMVNELGTWMLKLAANDTDTPKNALTYRLISAPPGVTLDGTSGVLTWIPTRAQGSSTNLITVCVTDNGTPPLSSTNSFTVIVSSVSDVPAPGSERWEFQADSAVNCTPAIGEDGTIYFGSTTGRVYAVEGTTGIERWNFLTGGAATSPVLGNNDLLYVGSADGILYALNIQTGKKQWSFAAGAGVTTPAVGADGTVYVGSSGPTLFALNGLTSSNIWKYNLTNGIAGSAAIGADGTIYIASAGILHAIDSSTGTNRWMYNVDPGYVYTNTPFNVLPGFITSSPVIGSDGTIYVAINLPLEFPFPGPGERDISILALDTNGFKKWQARPSGNNPAYTSPAIGADGRIYTGFSYVGGIRKYGGGFCAMNQEGTVQWLMNTYEIYTSSGVPMTRAFGVHSSGAVGADGTVYFGSAAIPGEIMGGSDFNAYNGASGQRLWSFPLGGWNYSPPAIGVDGTVYIGLDSGKLYALVGNSPLGLARSSWAKAYGNARNSGSSSASIAGSDYVIHRLAVPMAVTSLAGSGVAAFQDGTGTNASFNAPGGCWVTPEGVIYVADTANHRIRRVSIDGTVTTLAGTGVAGHLDGPAATAQFSGPIGICLDSQGNLWIAETNNYIRKIDGSGQVTTVAGTGVSGYVDGPGSIAQFNAPHALVADNLNNVWVTDSNNHAVRRIAADGTVSTWAGNGTAGDVDGDSEVALLNQPSGIARDSAGSLYVSERGGNRIRRIAVDGHVDTMAGSGIAGYIDGAAGQARFNQPDGLVLDAQNHLWVADVQNQVVRRIDPQGTVQTAAGTLQAGYAEGSGKDARFSSPSGLGMDGHGVLYVLDTGNSRLRKITLSLDFSLVAIPDQTVDVLQTLTLNVPLVDTNAYGSVQFNLVLGPDGMRIDARTGVLTWTPTLLQGRTTNHVTVRVSNAEGIGDTKTFQVRVSWPGNVPGGELWEFTAGGAISGCPAIDDNGTIYFGSADTNVYAVNGVTGQKIWSFATGGAVNCAPVYSILGLVYIGSDDGNLYAIDAKSGKEKWHYPASQAIRGTLAIGADRTVYFGSDTNKICALDGFSGANKWVYEADGLLVASPVIGSDGTIYFEVRASTENGLGWNATICALEPTTGTLLWKTPNFSVLGGSGLALGKNDYAWFSPGTLCAADLKTGTTNLSCGPALNDGISINDPDYTSKYWGHYYDVTDWLYARQGFIAPAIGADGTIYCAMHTKSLWAMDGLSGTQKWSFAAGDFIASAPSVGSDGTIYAGTMGGTVYALDGASGAELWHFPADGTPSPAAIGTSGIMYVGSANGILYAIVGNSNSGGLANSSWPKYQGNAKNTGNVFPEQEVHKPVLTVPTTQVIDDMAKTTLYLSASDPYATTNPLTFSLVSAPAGVALDSINGVLTWTPTLAQRNSTNPITVQVADIFGATDVKSFNIVVKQHTVQLVVPPDQTMDELATITLTNSVTGWLPATNIASYSLLASPKGVTLDKASGVLNWTPALGQGPSTNIVTVQVTDVFGTNDAKSFQIIVIKHAVDLIVPQNQTIYELTTLKVTNSVAKVIPATNKFTYTLVSAPSGMTLDAVSGALAWTPTLAQALTTNLITIQVTDSFGFSDAKSFVVTVKKHNYLAAPGQEVWSFSPNEAGNVSSAAIGNDGTVYLGTWGYFYALDGVTAAKKWEFDDPYYFTWAPIAGTNGMIYIRNNGGVVRALDAATGAIIWETSIGDFIPMFDLVLADNGLLFAGSDSVICALDAQSGAKQWELPLNSLNMVFANGLLYVGADKIYAIDAVTSHTNWIFNATNCNLALGSNGTVYAASDKVYALKGDTGTELWAYQDTGSYAYPTIMQDGSILVAQTEPGAILSPGTSKLLVLNSLDGHKLRSSATLNQVYAWPLIGDDGTIYVKLLKSYFPSGGRYCALNGVDGTIAWEYPCQCDTGGSYSPTLANGFLYIDTVSQGGLTALMVKTNTGLANSSWPKYRGNLRNTGSLWTKASNQPPVLTVPATQIINEQVAFSLQLAATDPNFPPNKLTFGLVSAPQGVKLNATSGLLTWTPTEAQGPSTNLITVSVTDNGTPALSVTNSFTIQVKEVPHAPVFTTPPAQFVDALATLTLQLVATDPDLPTNALTYSLVSAPQGVGLNPATGLLTWTPTEAQAPSTNIVRVEITKTPIADASSVGTIGSFTIQVNARNHAPVLTTSIRNFSVAAGATLVFTNTATDADVPANKLVYQLNADAPTGARLDQTTGVFTWTAPASIGTNRFTITVSDNGTPSLSDSQIFTIVTIAAHPIQIQSIAMDASGTIQLHCGVGAGITFQLQYKSDIDDPQWQNVGGTITSTNESVTFSDSMSTNSQRFYRVIQKGN